MYTPVTALTQEFGKLIDPKKPLHAMFATYNSISGYPDEIVKTGKQGLSIVTQCGHMGPSSFQQLGNMILFAMSDNVTPILQQMENRANEAKQILQKLDDKPTPSDTQLLAVFYAGFSAFNAVLDIAKTHKRENPLSTILIVTCNCSEYDKHHTLTNAKNRDEITDFLITNECGGDETMSKIITELIAFWPEN